MTWASDPRHEAKTQDWTYVECLDDGNTACKHGRKDCERCGTNGRRDALHATRNGHGKIAKLQRRKP